MALFLSHAWRPDDEGRDVHARVRAVSVELNRLGHSTWLDEERIADDVDASMARGIDACRAVVVFVTRAYVEKVNAAASRPHLTDNCYKELSYALIAQRPLLPVVFERSMRDVRAWPPGVAKMNLGSKMYVDGASHDAPHVARSVATALRRSATLTAAPTPTRPAPVLVRPAAAASRGAAPPARPPRALVRKLWPFRSCARVAPLARRRAPF